MRAFTGVVVGSLVTVLVLGTGGLSKDRRFRYAYVNAWEERLDAKQMKRLKDAVLKAYKKRTKRFRDLASEIEGFEAELR